MPPDLIDSTRVGHPHFREARKPRTRSLVHVTLVRDRHYSIAKWPQTFAKQTDPIAYVAIIRTKKSACTLLGRTLCNFAQCFSTENGSSTIDDGLEDGAVNTRTCFERQSGILSVTAMLQQSRPLVREPAVESKNADAGPADSVNGNSLCELVRPAVQWATD